jgi:triosephosphate isomerase
VGETLGERQAGRTLEIIAKQLDAVAEASGLDAFSSAVVAYEPVWAIGTGVTASPEQAQEMHAFIRQMIDNQFGNSIANSTTILYGGSVKPANAEELFGMADVDGGLVGGASLSVENFVPIIAAR